MTDQEPRYLVYRCGWQGLGHIGVSILNCLRAAAATGRVLALDMRDFRYFREDAAHRFNNHFTFELPGGVSVITDPDTVAGICGLPDRYEPPAWQGADPLEARSEQVVIITSDVVRHVQTLADKFSFWPNRWVPRGALAERIGPALLTRAAGIATIGVYFRSGNGEFLDFRFDPVSLPDYAARYEELVERYADIARLSARQFPGCRVRFYVASDSPAFVAAMRSRLGDVISHGEGGIGGLFRMVVEAGNDGLDALANAVIDVWNLAQCDSLIHNPSLFPEFAALNSEQLSSETTYCVEPSTLRSIVDRLEAGAALDYLDRALERQPMFWWRVRAGILRFRIGALERASQLKSVAALVRRAEQLEACFALGGMSCALGRMEALHVQEARDAALAHGTQDNPFVVHFVAMAEALLGRHHEALDRVEAALVSWSDIPELHVARVRILAALGRVTRAVRASAQAIEACGHERVLLAERDHVAGCILDGGRALRDVAIGCPAQQSSRSRWSGPSDPQGLVGGVAVVPYQMHTEIEDNPWWLVELGRAWPVRCVVVRNRDQEAWGHLADGLIVEGKMADGTWFELGRAQRRFTGARGGEPLRLWFDPPPMIMAIRVRLEGKQVLHLQQVEVFAPDTDRD